MVEVFITEVQDHEQSVLLRAELQKEFKTLQITIDLNESEHAFPCGHTIVRVEGEPFEEGRILQKIEALGFRCKVLEDKICP